MCFKNALNLNFNTIKTNSNINRNRKNEGKKYLMEILILITYRQLKIRNFIPDTFLFHSVLYYFLFIF